MSEIQNTAANAIEVNAGVFHQTLYGNVGRQELGYDYSQFFTRNDELLAVVHRNWSSLAQLSLRYYLVDPLPLLPSLQANPGRI